MTKQDITYILAHKRWPFKPVDFIKILLILIPALVLIWVHRADVVVIFSVTAIAGFGLFKLYQGFLFTDYEAKFGKMVNSEKLLYAFKQLDHTLVEVHEDYICVRSPSSMVSSGSFITALPCEHTVMLNARSVLGIRFKKDLDTLDLIVNIIESEAYHNNSDEEE